MQVYSCYFPSWRETQQVKIVQRRKQIACMLVYIPTRAIPWHGSAGARAGINEIFHDRLFIFSFFLSNFFTRGGGWKTGMGDGK